MENLHSGPDKREIEKQYNKVLKLKFPEAPEDDLLYDLFSELVDMDSYIMGCVSTYLKTGTMNENSLVCDKEFLQMCIKIYNRSEEFDTIIQYKKELDKLVSLLKN